MNDDGQSVAGSDACVFFGATGDLAYKMILPALYQMVKRGSLASSLRFRLSPSPLIAIAARVKRAGEEFVGEQRELTLHNAQPGEEQPYERLLGDALAGDGALFTREDSVEAAWAVVDPVLDKHHRAHPCRPGSWAPRKRTRSSPRTDAGTILNPPPPAT